MVAPRKQRGRKNKTKVARKKFCTRANKVKYRNRREADDELRYRRALHELSSEKVPVRSYRCPHCGYWHLTAMELHDDS
jgi:rubrerythrin